MVAMCTIIPARGLLGQMPSFVDLHPWSLNVPYAKHRRSQGEDNP